ncbi:hypothetical protein [Streptomyces phaeochromogenes]
MAHRPYPNPRRALAQVYRRQLGPVAYRAYGRVQRPVEPRQDYMVDVYRLSTR